MPLRASFTLLAFLLAWGTPLHAELLQSPNERLSVHFSQTEDGGIAYSVFYDGDPVVNQSPLGIVVDGADFGTSIESMSIVSRSNQSAKLPVPEQTDAIDIPYSRGELWITHSRDDDTFSRIEVRLYDNCFAFRYEVPGYGKRLLSDEKTGWNIPLQAKVWVRSFEDRPEGLWMATSPAALNAVAPLPVVVELAAGNRFLLITEADRRHAPALSLVSFDESPYILVQHPEEEWSIYGSDFTPWRVTMIADNLGALSQTRLVIETLADAPDPLVFPASSASHWIRPGKMISSYWTDPSSSGDLATQRTFIDYATLFGFEYVYLGPGWRDGFQTAERNWFEHLSDLTAHASNRDRKIGIWVHEQVETLLDEEQRSQQLWLYSQANVAGIVIDSTGFADIGTQETSTALERAYRAAGNLQLQLALHGNFVPNGQTRTYPNIIGVDGTLGLDEALLQNDFKVPVEQNAIVPFTRSTLGFTMAPAISLDPARRGSSTTMHQIAAAGIVDAPLLSVWENPLTLLERDVVRNILRTLPTEWDETRILPQSSIGELALVARRKSETWYLFALNGSSEATRNVLADLSFIGQEAFDLIEYVDVDQDVVARNESYALDPISPIPIELRPSGGYVGVVRARATELREFKMGFEFSPPAMENLPSHELVRVDATSSVPWSVAANESGYEEYPTALLEHWSQTKAALDPEKSVYLVVSPFASGAYTNLALEWGESPNQPLAAPWDDYSFSSPTVKTAYANYLKSIADFFDPEFLSVAPEANRALTENASEWEAAKSLLVYAQTELAASMPEIKVVTSLSYETLIGETIEAAELRELYADTYPNVLTSEPATLLASSEIVALSLFPAMTESDLTLPQYLERGLAFASENERPLAIDRVAFPSKPFPLDAEGTEQFASDAIQFNRLERLLKIAYDRHFPFVVYSAAKDQATNAKIGLEALVSVSGLLDSSGASKPALALWNSFQDIDFVDLSLQPTLLDSDGDGVVNSVDVAPDNPHLSSTHYFFEDADKDNFGSSMNLIAIDSDVPPPNTAVWRGDPDDRSKLAGPTIQDKGLRRFSVGVWGDGSSGDNVLTELQELGVDTVAIELDWNRIESASGVFDGPDMARLNDAVKFCKEQRLALTITLNVIRGSSLVVPEELKSALSFQVVSWTDEFVQPRFEDLLRQILLKLGDVKLVSLQLASNVSEYRPDSDDSAFWSSFHAFVSHAQTVAEQACRAAVPVGLRIQARTQADINSVTGTLKDILLAQDFIGIDYSPVDADSAALEPTAFVNELSGLLNSQPTANFRLFQLGYPSSVERFSSQTKQSQFVLGLFEVWDAFAARLDYIGFQSMPDGSDAEHLSSGFITSEAERKRAFHTLRTQTMNRGWWGIPRADRRSFHMGFTHTTFDSGETFEEIEAIDEWMWSRIEKDSDIVNLQLDGGIPWIEALADDFSNDYPPYANFVLGFWEKLKAETPKNHKIVVSFSPTGNPRSRLEAYWGYGSEVAFVDDEGFVVEPSGEPKETVDAFLPFPWDKFRFNDEPVKIALVNYAKRVIQFFEPDYLVVGLEASESISEDPVRFDEYIELQTHLYNALKADPSTRDIPLIVSVSSTSLMTDEFGVPYKFDQQPDLERDKQIEGLRRLLPIADIIGISHYPHFGKFNAEVIPGGMYESFFKVLKDLGAEDKPVAITESGYTADPFTIFDTKFDGTPQKQDLYLRHLIYEMEKAPNPVEFIINYEIRDTDYTWLRQKAKADSGLFNPVFLQFLQYFRDIGIYDGDGNITRPVYYSWTQALSAPLLPKGIVVSEGLAADAFLSATVERHGDEFWLALRFRLEDSSVPLEYTLEQSSVARNWSPIEIDEEGVVATVIPAALCGDTVDNVETKIRLSEENLTHFFRLIVSKAQPSE